MLVVTGYLRHDVISRADPCIEIASPEFASHILDSPLLSKTHIIPDYSRSASKAVIRLGNKLKDAASGILIAAVAYSPEDHWACLLNDSKARTIRWGDFLGRAMPADGEDRLRV
jgi:hypothetical protein